MISKDFHKAMNGGYAQGFGRKCMSIVRKMAYDKVKITCLDWILHS